MGVVINLTAWHNTGQLGGHFAYFQAGDKAESYFSFCSLRCFWHNIILEMGSQV